MNTNVKLLGNGRSALAIRRTAGFVHLWLQCITCVTLIFAVGLPANAQTNGLLPVVIGSVSVGDFDNDGQLDLLWTGNNNGGVGYSSLVLHNLGNGIFTNVAAGLPGVSQGAVAWGDYDNDGNLDILMTGLSSGLTPICELWHNEGNGTFKQITTQIPGVYQGSVAWGDYDNDGKLDILISGLNANGVPICQLWRNQGNGNFANVPIPLPGIALSSLAWGDYDNDGNLDILISGYNATNAITQIWRNLGNGTFTNINAPLPGVYYSSVAWGDYDNDGNLDVLLCGYNGTNPISQIWRNLGNGFFTNISALLTGVSQGVAAWGDYDNDGRLDVLLIGADSSHNKVSQIWHNTGNSAFMNLNVGLTPVSSGSAVFGNFENDSSLDVILTGQSSSGTISQFFHNPTAVTNQVPSAPSNLLALPTSSGVTLGWAAASDAQTPSAGLSYNLRVGTSPGGSDIISPESNVTNGFRRLTQLGNAQERVFSTLNLPPGNYYWSVQAIDTSFAGSPFAPEATFTLNAQVNTLPASQIAFTSATLNGTVNPRSATTTAWFQYGNTTSYGLTTSPQNLGNGTNAISLSQTLPQLTANTIYDYQAVASNQFGISYGGNQVFTTASNTPPLISSIPNVSTALSTPPPPIPFSVWDASIPASNLVVTVTCSDPSLVPPANLVLGGAGTNRWLAITPASGQRGSTVITLAVSDGVALGASSFILNVGVVPGDLNGDGIVDQAELNVVLSNYWQNSPWVMMTNFTSLGGGIFEFTLTNATSWDFSVMCSTNMIDWTALTTPAIPVYKFRDTNASPNGPQKFYRLRYP